jgi:hypothetical protein
VNERGVVVGRRGLPLFDVGFVWSADGGVVLLDPIPGGQTSFARDVNGFDVVVGNGLFAKGGGPGRGFLWDAGSVNLLEPLPGDVASAARAINDAGQVVGDSNRPDGSWRPVIWNALVGYDLGELLADDGVLLRRMKALGEDGRVVCEAHSADFDIVTVVLTPVRRPRADVDFDCEVGEHDLLLLLGAWGSDGPPASADLDQNGTINFRDLLLLLSDWY